MLEDFGLRGLLDRIAEGLDRGDAALWRLTGPAGDPAPGDGTAKGGHRAFEASDSGG